MKIGKSELDKFLKKGTIRGWGETGNPVKKAAEINFSAHVGVKKIAPKQQLKQDLKIFCDQQQHTFIAEKMFHVERQWRMDWAIITKHGLKIAIEYDGIHSKKSRHTTQSGFQEDTVKLNEALLAGWHVFRFTHKTAKDAISLIEQFITKN